MLPVFIWVYLPDKLFAKYVLPFVNQDPPIQTNFISFTMLEKFNLRRVLLFHILILQFTCMLPLI